MSLIRCAACSATISSKAQKCPKCGSPLTAAHSISFECSECGTSLPFEHTGPCPECGDPEPGPSVIVIEEAPQQSRAAGKSPLGERRREIVPDQSTSRAQPASSKATAHDAPDPVAAHRQTEAQRIRLRINDLSEKTEAYRDLGKAKNIFTTFAEGFGCVFSLTTVFAFLFLMYVARDSKTGSQIVIVLFVAGVVFAVIVAPILEATKVRKHARETRDREVELKLLREQLVEIEATQ